MGPTSNKNGNKGVIKEVVIKLCHHPSDIRTKDEMFLTKALKMGKGVVLGSELYIIV